MKVVKVLKKGQVTLPIKIRQRNRIHEGDTLIIEEIDGKIVLKKGKTIFDYIGVLPDKGVSIEDMREVALEEMVKGDG